MFKKILKKMILLITIIITLIVLILFIKNVLLKKSLNSASELLKIESVSHRIERLKKTYQNLEVVQNKNKGLWENNDLHKIELRHELTISESTENLEIYRAGQVISDNYGNIYVYEGVDGRILKFSKTGELLIIIGNKGKGPGEFSGGLSMVIDNKKLVVLDQALHRVSWFDLEGKLLYSKNIPNLIGRATSFTIINSNSFFVSGYSNKYDNVIFHYNFNGSLKNHFGEPVNFIEPLSRVAYSVKINISNGSLLHIDDYLWYSQLNPYEIRKYTLNGELKKIIFRSNKFMPLLQVERSKGGAFTMYSPATTTLLGGWKDKIVNCIFVPETVSQNIGSVIDIYDKEGNLLFNIKLKERIVFTFIDGNGKLYGHTLGINSSQKILVYSLIEK